jgi:hypothetical protein
MDETILPNKNTNEEKNNAAENVIGWVPESSGKLPSKPFQMTEDDEFERMRKAMLEMESNQEEHPEPNPFSWLPEDHQQTNEVFTLETNSADLNSEETRFSDNKQSGNNIQSSPFFTPFSDDDFDSEENLTYNRIFEVNPGENVFGDRIDSIRNESNPIRIPQTESIPPFVMEETQATRINTNSLPDQIRHGVVPAETLQLLITGSMTEGEVIKVAKDLGIIWALIPGDNREEKTQFLIDYFNNTENHKTIDPGQVTPNPAYLTAFSEDDWRESDRRLQALQDALDLPEGKRVEEKSSFVERIKNRFNHSDKLLKQVTIGLVLLAVLLSIVIVFVLFSKKQEPAVTIPPTAVNSLPFPTKIQFPGGWSFDLQAGNLVNGNWNPTSAEWLRGTEICRLVSIPWSKQLDAVFQTFSVGNNIGLTMSNADLLNYKVEKVETVKSSEVFQIINRPSPCLVVVLTQENSDDRQILIGAPDFGQKK